MSPRSDAGEAPFDVETMLRQTDGLVDLALEVIQLFRADLPAMAARLTEATASGDPERVVRAAHQLRGALLTVAAGPAGRLAGAVELDARGGRLEGADARLRSLALELARLDQALASFLAQPR